MTVTASSQACHFGCMLNDRTTYGWSLLSFECYCFLACISRLGGIGGEVGQDDKMQKMQCQDRRHRLPAAISTFNANAVTANHSGQQALNSPPPEGDTKVHSKSIV